ncbi:uncharacterized protein LDX57_006929 [Aspergillus melleus]|uniref:uncharacterized protein n=1 Tax=Aspergillus melleus TaxID=138277 RepID=UPI001E8E4AB9|nr:uncharacterized protein LDX57_006929 [Aspergillus melleus]KAH8429262.1 hypothetical protein LDX57_006929 [Aspergillus melleus]
MTNKQQNPSSRGRRRCGPEALEPRTRKRIRGWVMQSEDAVTADLALRPANLESERARLRESQRPTLYGVKAKAQRKVSVPPVNVSPVIRARLMRRSSSPTDWESAPPESWNHRDRRAIFMMDSVAQIYSRWSPARIRHPARAHLSLMSVGHGSRHPARWREISGLVATHPGGP